MRNPAKREKPQKRSVFKAFWWRRGRDSNPCGVAPKRFSRPPRYDRFDTSPYGYLIVEKDNSEKNKTNTRNREMPKIKLCKAICDENLSKWRMMSKTTMQEPT